MKLNRTTGRITFLSTLSLRRATSPCAGRLQVVCNFYPRSPCGERPTKSDPGASNQPISIHALLAESDGVTILGVQHRTGISIHALLAESDSRQVFCFARQKNFYPRSPCGERRIIDIINNVIDDFYPRSPCGERP